MSKPVPLLNHQHTRAYLDFIGDARAELTDAQWGALIRIGDEAVAAWESRAGERVRNAEAVHAAVMHIPEMQAYFRTRRSLQEMVWQCALEYGEAQRADWLAAMDAAEDSGPGSLRRDPNFDSPAYAQHDIHVQPGGYSKEPLAGLVYDLGTRPFFGRDNMDTLHARLAEHTATPRDGAVNRAIEIGCSVGQLACALKERFTDAEVWGTDIAAPMVRYAHWRAVQLGCAVHFAQMAGEQMDFPDAHFDLAVTHLLFHEIPLDITRRVLAETFRILRPGGTLVVWDFPTARPGAPGYDNFFGIMDAADNGEPYALAFVRADFEAMIEAAGFTLRYTTPDDLRLHGRVGDKS